jgi:DNA polymerase IV (DinB-like DNA polymerase)
MPIFLAKKKLENTDAVFLPVDFGFYEGISASVMQTLRSFADRFEQTGIDEAYLDVTQRTNGSFEEGKALTSSIKEELKTQQQLTCSVGVGPNKLVAKIAADSNKPDGLTIIKPEQVQPFLSPLPVDRLIGVGTKTTDRMHALGIHTVFDLSNYDIQKLIAAFGRTQATYFHNASLGIDNEPVEEKDEAESISRISTLKQDSRDVNFILEKADQLCNEIHSIVTSERLTFRTVGILLIAEDMSMHTRSKTLENSTDRLEPMKKTVKELLEKFLNETGLEARRVGVKVSGLVREHSDQKRLTSFMEQTKP